MSLGLKILARWFLTAIAFMLAAYLVPGIVVASLYIALILALFWGILNLILKPILILLTFPLTIVTLGLFVLLINTFLFWFLGTFVKGFEVHGFIAAFTGALVLTLAHWVGHKFIE